MKTYEFTIKIVGSGSSMGEAWEDAWEAFSMEPGEPDEGNCRVIEDDEEPDEIIVEVQGGVAYCDDPRVEIIDHDNH